MNVLIVDDDPAIRGLLCMALQEDVQTVSEAPDGETALDYLRDSAVPLVVLLDWQMPRLDGRGVLRAVAADPRLRATHQFVLITATDVSQDPEATTLLEHLQISVIGKPFNLNTVFTAVGRAAATLGAASAGPRVVAPSTDDRPSGWLSVPLGCSWRDDTHGDRGHARGAGVGASEREASGWRGAA